MDRDPVTGATVDGAAGTYRAQPLLLPIRVIVKGPSTVGWVSWMGGPPSDFTFPRAIEAELLRMGRPAEVRSYTQPAEPASTALRSWDREVVGFSPDVVVLVYGHYETIHLVLPRWLERHARSLHTRPGGIRRLYRRNVVRPIWKTIAGLQARLDTVVNPNVRHRDRRVSADVGQLIENVRQVGSPLVFVFELQPPASGYDRWFPGMAARIHAMNAALAALVDRIANPDVRWFSTSDVIAEHAGGNADAAMPDGFHYTPDVHYAIGADLARRIADWADMQQHLKRDS